MQILSRKENVANVSEIATQFLLKKDALIKRHARFKKPKTRAHIMSRKIFYKKLRFYFMK